ncbi:MAG TPA: C4-dicarboxylate transporter DctA [Phycisphaerae bacterium]|jgi:Na+/H+-dicarboxylate symporter
MHTVIPHSGPTSAPAVRKPFYRQLYFYVIMGFLVGIALGLVVPDFAKQLDPLGKGFIKLIRMLLAPIVFGTIVVGVVQMGSLKEVGRVGIKALFYFEVLTTFALLIGLGVVNWVQPGIGLSQHTAQTQAVTRAAASSVATYTESAQHQGVVDFLMNIIPSSIADAFVQGNMLQVIFFSVLFALALTHLPQRGENVVKVVDTGVQAMFGIVRVVMVLSPVAAMGATAAAVATQGPDVLVSYGKLIACLYVTTLLFVFVVLGLAARLGGISIWRFLVYIRDEIVVTFATASSETAMPRLMIKLEQMGCKKSVVGLVVPAGYTFNADGTCIYMTMGAIFLAQATGTPLTWQVQMVVMAVCLLTSKGAAGVSGAGFIALAATLASMNKIPVASLALLVGIDRFLSEARAVTNLIGNGVATVVVARWENSLDRAQAQAMLAGKNGEAVSVAAGELGETKTNPGRTGVVR